MEFKYNLNHDFRGTALIIGNEFQGQGDLVRSGCLKDVIMMKEVFRKLDFNVKTFMNLSVAKMKEKLEKASKDENNEISDCFVFCLSTHGNEKRPDEGTSVPPGANVWQNAVFGEDMESLLVEDIIDYFTDKKAVGLVDKPKMFFIQACRSRDQHLPSPGDKFDPGVEMNVSSGVQGLTNKPKDTGVSRDSADWVHTMDLTDAEDIYKGLAKDPRKWVSEKEGKSPGSQTTEQDAAGGFSVEDARGSGDEGKMPHAPFNLVPKECPDDFLIMYPVMSGKYAFRHKEDGSYLIQSLYKAANFIKLLRGCDVLQYLTHVCQDMAEYEYNPFVQGLSKNDLKTMMFRNIKHLSREDNQSMLVTVIGKACEKKLKGDVAIVESNLQDLIMETLTEQQMKDILDKILPFKMTACLLHRLKGTVVFQPKRENTPMGKLENAGLKVFSPIHV